MTKLELEQAQFLLGTSERAMRLAEKIDPNRNGEGAATLDGLAATARRAFFDLTGRTTHSVSFVELSTEYPAPWTKLKTWDERSQSIARATLEAAGRGGGK